MYRTEIKYDHTLKCVHRSTSSNLVTFEHRDPGCNLAVDVISVNHDTEGALKLLDSLKEEVWKRVGSISDKPFHTFNPYCNMGAGNVFGNYTLYRPFRLTLNYN